MMRKVPASLALATVLFSPLRVLASTPDASIDEALDQDLTPVSPSDGALFVPALTSPEVEPLLVVLHAGERVASGTTGQRIALPPGRYTVDIATELEGVHAQSEVVVRRGQTTTVEPFFGAVRVAAVDLDGAGVSTDFVVASARDRAVVARGHIDPKGKAPQPTFLLPPGEYVVVAGSSPTATSNAFAVSVARGAVVRYRLVLDGDRVVRSEFGDSPKVASDGSGSPWRVRWLVGASGSATRATNTLSTVQGDSILLDLFSRFEGGIVTRQHAATLRLDVDQRLVGLSERTGFEVPLRPVTNEVTGELFYNYRMGGVIGPYARGLGRTALFATNARAPSALDVVTVDSANAFVSREALAAQDNVRLFGPLAPLVFVEDAGLALTVVDDDAVTIGVRGGPGFRQAYFDGGRFIRESEPGRLLLQRLDDNTAFGGVGTATAEVRLFGTVSVSSRFDAFVPAKQLSETVVPAFRWDNTAAVRLGRYASVAYQVSVRRDDVALPELQTLQGLQLRVSYGIF